MKKAPKGIKLKRKGYVEGGQVQLDANGNPIMSEKEKNARQLGNAAGNALGAYGSSYYATKENVSEGDSIRSGALGAVGKSGAIGGAVAGIAGIGDQIGKPTRTASEKVDMSGDVVNEGKAKRNAIIGTTLSPSQRLSYKGGLTDVSGDAYIRSLEEPKKLIIEQEKKDAAQAQLDEALAARERGEVGYTAVNKYKPHEFKKGGTITGKGTGTSDSINAEVEEGSFVVPAHMSGMAKMIKSALGMKKGKADLHQKKDAVPVKLSNGEELLTPEEKNKVKNKLGEETLEALAPEAEENTNELAKGTTEDGVEGEPTKIGEKKSNTKDTKGTKETKKPAKTTKGGYKKPTRKPLDLNYIDKPNLSLTETNDALRQVNNVNSNAVDTNPVSTKPSETKQTSSKSNFWDKVQGINTEGLGSTIANYGLAAYQISEGRKGLKDKRPVNQIDPTFLENVNTAQANAKFGFTPEQKFMLDQQNQALLNADRFAARNYAGGSAGSAFGMERSASNNAFMRSLQNASANTELQQQKQGFAANLALQKANMSRNIFEDALRAHEMKNAAAGQTVAAGISNIADTNRFANYMRLRNQEQDFSNKYNV